MAHLALLLVVCGGIYWPMLGSAGLSSTEGHRAIPGWAMLESGDWLRVTMFELGYLRKPPGMPWAVAAASAALGPTEFAARAVSAAATTLTALLCYLFATRWFGRPWGLAAGLGLALMPQLWTVGRAAEIEALNNLATFGAAALLVELVLPREGRRRWGAALVAVGAGAAVALTVLAKGPASAPVLAAVPIAACIAVRSARPLLRPPLWGAGALAAVVLVIVGKWILAANDAPGTVRQGVSDFLWSPERMTRIAMLAPAALGAAMPMSLALLLPLRRWARAQGEDGARARAGEIARTLAWAWVIALGMYTLAGVSNSRYAMPAAVLLPALGAYAAAAIAGRGGWPGTRGGWALVAALCLGAAVFIPIWEGQRHRASGRGPGGELARAIAGDAPAGSTSVVWADEMIDTRPEVLLYAARAGAGLGVEIRPVWAKPAMSRGEAPARGTYVLLRSNAPGSLEPGRFAGAIEAGRLVPVAEGTVHKFAFTLYRSAGEP